MLTPIEVQGKVFKSGIGYDKKEVETFLKEVSKDYEGVYKENVELNDKINVLSEGIQYYKTIEKTLQKALVLAEKTAEETENSAKNKAMVIVKEAEANAKDLLVDAQRELDKVKLATAQLKQQYEAYRTQFKNLAVTQVELLNSSAFNIDVVTTKIDDVKHEEKKVSAVNKELSTDEINDALSKELEAVAAKEKETEKKLNSSEEENNDFDFVDVDHE